MTDWKNEKKKSLVVWGGWNGHTPQESASLYADILNQEGYQGVGLLPGALGPDSPGIGIAIKISDGDPTDRARNGVMMAILKALGALNESQLEQLAKYGPQVQLENFRKLKVGVSQPAFVLNQG